jgi:hypothetical protein
MRATITKQLLVDDVFGQVRLPSNEGDRAIKYGYVKPIELNPQFAAIAAKLEATNTNK